jgi:ribosome biogenesis GTPase A
MGFWPVVLNVLRNSDVVLLLVDARMPEVGRNSEIVNKIREGKRLIYVFNKVDLVGKKDIEALRSEYPEGFFVSCKKRTGIKDLKKALVEMAEGRDRSSLRVGIVGYPNIGKSSLINLLVPGAGVKVSSVSGTTKKTQWIRSGKLRIMDSPGVIPFGDSGARVGVMSGKDAHKIKNPEKVAIRVIKFLMEKNVLKKYYGVSGSDAYEVFDRIGRKKGFLVKGGEVDENRTAIRIIEDWQRGRIKLK